VADSRAYVRHAQRRQRQYSSLSLCLGGGNSAVQEGNDLSGEKWGHKSPRKRARDPHARTIYALAGFISALLGALYASVPVGESGGCNPVPPATVNLKSAAAKAACGFEPHSRHRGIVGEI
jgi:hypothetical protein